MDLFLVYFCLNQFLLINKYLLSFLVNFVKFFHFSNLSCEINIPYDNILTDIIENRERFTDVQCLIEEWESREVEETDDRSIILCSRRKSSEFLRKLAIYETGGENLVRRDKENTPPSSFQEFLNVDMGEINPTNQFEIRKCSRTVPGRIEDGELLLAEVPTNQRGDNRMTL